MALFSANLGFLWSDLPLTEAIRAAKAAGFDAVECHWPYDTPPTEVAAALSEADLHMIGLNTRRGERPGDRGLAAVPGRREEARGLVDEAIAYAAAIGASAVHVMAGTAAGAEAHDVFAANLAYAAARADRHGLVILIEPLNRHDAPGYFLRTTEQARDLIATVDAPNLRLMFDCYHVGRTEGDLVTRLHHLLPIIGHIQFAAVPDRGAPDHGEIDYRHVLAEIDGMGWTTPVGAEYRPRGATADTLGWMSSLR